MLKGVIPSARRRSALPFRLLAASTRWRSRSSLSPGLSARVVRDVAGTVRDLDFAPLRMLDNASSESESSMALSGGGEADSDPVRWRFAFSGFLQEVSVSAGIQFDSLGHLLFTVASPALGAPCAAVAHLRRSVFFARFNSTPKCFCFVVSCFSAVHGRPALSGLSD